MSLDIEELYKEIQDLRDELEKDYEKCLAKSMMDIRVVDMSQKLDKLIVAYENIIKSRSVEK